MMNKKQKQKLRQRRRLNQKISRDVEIPEDIANPVIDEKEYYYSIFEIVKLYPRERVIFYVLIDRESGKGQKGNALDRKPFVLEECERQFAALGRKCKCVGYFYENVSGKANHLDERTELRKAIRAAKKLKAVPIVPSINRLVRSASEGRDVPLREDDIAAQQAFTGNVRIASVIPPGSSHAEVKSYFSKWGQQAKGNKGGRPTKPAPPKPREVKRIRETCLPDVLRLHRQGYSSTEITDAIKNQYDERIPDRTIRRWIQCKKPSECKAKSRLSYP